MLKTGISTRIWDNFFLDGEIFTVKVGIAILKYFELELKLSTFDYASKFSIKFAK